MLLELPGVGFLDPGQVRRRDTGMKPSIEGLLSRSLHLTLILSTVLQVRHVRLAPRSKRTRTVLVPVPELVLDRSSSTVAQYRV